ncbi:MAG: hypothetical protein JRN43_01940 [Nitrososphaerota archaeon]|nr:hypothetical protein [Nitrososphaerota archaeon]MDG7019056.1 hypothetical protein [Nitrososphaerota archaeon]
MIEGRYYKDVSAIQELVDFGAASAAIRGGWELLTIRDLSVTTVDSQGRPQLANRPVYILGWIGKSQKEAKAKVEAPDLEGKLEALEWKAASSGKCDFVRNPTKDLLDAIDAKDGFKGSRHHFTKARDGSAVFRFARKAGGEARNEESRPG